VLEEWSRVENKGGIEKIFYKQMEHGFDGGLRLVYP
jgi:hypothetical protein